jgi:hypothetical protein
VAFWLELDNAYWAGTSAALVCQPHLGASLRKGWYRMIGTVVGAFVIVVLTACFPQDRDAFMLALALWGAACALVSTLLRNFAAYAAALAGYTAAIIASDQLGATGGLNGDAFMLAIFRASEICIGIVCAGVVLAGTDFGAAPRRLAELLAALSAEMASRFTNTLVQAGSELSLTQPFRRDLIRRAVALDPVMDEAIGESSRIRYHSPSLRAAMGGLFSALSGWRGVSVRLARLAHSAARQQADVVLNTFRASCNRHRHRASRRAGWPIPSAWGDAAMRRFGHSSRCRRARLRCGCSPTRRPRFWPECRMRSKDWRCSSPPLAEPAPAAAASGSTCRIGCRLWSMPPVPSSPSAPSRCSGS